VYEIACSAKRRDFAVGAERGRMAARRSLTPVTTSAALLLILIISGCATRQSLQLPDLTNWDTRTAVLAGLDDWEFSGRVGVSTETDGFDGKLRWIQEGDKFQATVSGKLGIGAIRVEGDGHSVVLTDKDGVKTELRDAELELQYRYGWTIPVESLRYWAMGIPDPVAEPVGQHISTFNAEGQLETLQQRGWLVTISRYKEGGGQSMPSRLSAVNPDTKVKLVIDQWVFLD
jgi:outer membrane lipoprotein LolB